MSHTKEQNRIYMRERARKRILEAKLLLGGQCAKCGSQELDILQFDHKDPATKSFTIAKGWSCSKKKFDTEVQKCQLLCTNCHQSKSIQERGQVPTLGTHGNTSAYARGCRCEPCKQAKSKYNKGLSSSS